MKQAILKMAEALQELKAAVDKQEERLTLLEKQVRELKNPIQVIEKPVVTAKEYTAEEDRLINETVEVLERRRAYQYEQKSRISAGNRWHSVAKVAGIAAVGVATATYAVPAIAAATGGVVVAKLGFGAMVSVALIGLARVFLWTCGIPV